MLAERDDGEAPRRLARGALVDGGREGPLQRPVGEVGKRLHKPLEGDRAGQVRHRKRGCQRAALAPKRTGEIAGRFARRFRSGDRLLGSSCLKRLGYKRKPFELNLEERRVAARSGERVLNPFFTLCFIHVTAQISSVEDAQRLKPCHSQRVLTHVNTLNPTREAMVHPSSRRFVKIAPPTVHAGVGNALREAFAMDGEVRSLVIFEELLLRLDEA